MQNACCADRLSDHRFWANQFWLALHAAVYWRRGTPRRWLTRRGTPHFQIDTLCLRLFKVGGHVREFAALVRLHLARSYPVQLLWHPPLRCLDHLTIFAG